MASTADAQHRAVKTDAGLDRPLYLRNKLYDKTLKSHSHNVVTKLLKISKQNVSQNVKIIRLSIYTLRCSLFSIFASFKALEFLVEFTVHPNVHVCCTQLN